MSLVSLCNIIPMPPRMNMDSVGVDISEVSIRFVRIETKQKGFGLLDFGEYLLPEGVISLGRINKPDVLRDILLRLKKEHNIKFVHASISESLAYLAYMDVPSVKDSELYGSIELQIEEHIPITLSEVAFDYQIMGTNKIKSGITNVVVYATQKEVVQSYQDVFASAGIILLSLETDSTALARVVIPKESTETTMIIDLGRIKTGVYIVSNGFVSFVSDIDIGGKDVITELVKKRGITSDEAKALYKKLEQNEKPEKEEYEVIASVFSELKEEINKHFIFWQSHKDKNGKKREKIGKIILCGSGAPIYGLQEYLSFGLNTPTSVANIWENLFSFEEDVPKISFQDSLLYSTAVGLAMYTKGV